MPAAGCVDELCGDAHTIAGTADRAFKYRLHAKLTADGANIDRTPLIGEARIACDHRKTRDLRQVGDDVFADSVGEILLLWIPRHVGEGQNSNCRMRLRNAGVGARAIGDGRVRVGMPPPDSNRPVAILDIDVATVLEGSIDPIADALVDDRGNTNA